MEFIKSNWGTIFSGCGVTLIIFILGLVFKPFKFFKTHKVIKSSEYNDLLKIKHNYVDLDELKKGLSFNLEYSIYDDKITNEKFCSTCIDNKKVKIHLKEEITQCGNTYRCPVCRGFFTDKGYDRRVEQENNNDYLNLW